MERVMFVCNSGGHLSEMLKLESLFKKYEYLLVTEKTVTTEKLKDTYNMKFMMYMTRKNIFSYIISAIVNFFKSITLLLKFKPKVIVTTGASIGGILCTLGKIMKCKIIYIESLAKIDSLSDTGDFVYYFADKFYVQWEDLLEEYPKAEYLGRLI